jgi:hypothetical protein
MWRIFAKFAVKATLVYAVVLVLYVMLWRGIVSGFIPISFTSASSFSPSFSSQTGSNQTLAISASAEMIVYRYGFLPVYWSRIGDLMIYHQICFSLLTVELIVASVLKYKRLTFPKQKLLKPKTSIPMHGGAQMPKNDKKSKTYSRIILTVWAFIGFLWFIVYQLLPVLPYDTSLVLVELLNYAMWIMVFASAGTLVLPYLKVLYYKIWEGGEKHE